MPLRACRWDVSAVLFCLGDVRVRWRVRWEDLQALQSRGGTRRSFVGRRDEEVLPSTPERTSTTGASASNSANHRCAQQLLRRQH